MMEWQGENSLKPFIFSYFSVRNFLPLPFSSWPKKQLVKGGGIQQKHSSRGKNQVASSPKHLSTRIGSLPGLLFICKNGDYYT